MLEPRGRIDLPSSVKKGGFDHAAIHRATRRLYVAHTANDAVDVIDLAAGRFVRSVGGLTGVAGALVSDERGLVFTSNRGEDTVSVFPVGREDEAFKVEVGVRPNGLAFDPASGVLLAANVGDPKIAGSHTLTIIDVEKRAVRASLPVPSRTRWTVFDGRSFFVNIADPPQIAVIEASDPTRIARTITVPAVGPHGLDLDPTSGRIFCACDGKALVVLDSESGRVLETAELGGVPDVIFWNEKLRHLYVAIGEPGTIEVFDTDRVERIQTVETELGAHTIAFEAATHRVLAFLPESHAAAVFEDVAK
jgi:DNA-binding beta-propeller fold protein YncE